MDIRNFSHPKPFSMPHYNNIIIIIIFRLILELYCKNKAIFFPLMGKKLVEKN